MRTCCPSCSSEVFVKNGFSRYGDQNHRCLECGRQFVLDPQNKIISDETKDMVRKLMLEKLSLQGICRVTNVSQNVQVPPDSLGLILERLEADELWSFVGKKKNQVWIW